MIRLVAALLLLAWAGAAHAVSDPREMLPDAQQEARAEAIGSRLRCLVCQNESIEDSAADLARELRAIVRQRVAAGDTDRQVVDWMVARYGNFVRLVPPFDAATALLWATPALALAIGFGAVFLLRRRTAPPRPLDPEEEQRLRGLLSGTNP